MSHTFGSINFGNIPVGAPGPPPVAYNADQGIILDGTTFKLGAVDFSSIIDTQRAIVIDGAGNYLELRTAGDLSIFTFGLDGSGNALSSFFVTNGITFSTFKFNATNVQVDTPNSAYDFLVNANSTVGLFALKFNTETSLENNTDQLGAGGAKINLKVFDDGGFNGVVFSNQTGEYVTAYYGGSLSPGASVSISGLAANDSATLLFVDPGAGNYILSGIDYTSSGGNFVIKDYGAPITFLEYDFATKGLTVGGADVVVESNGGDITMNIAGSQVLRATSAGRIAFAGATVNTNYIDCSGGTLLLNGGTQTRVGVGGNEKIRCTTVSISFLNYVGVGSTATANTDAWLSLAASSSGRGQLFLTAGTAPSAPPDGLLWFDGANLFMQVAGVTKTFTLT